MEFYVTAAPGTERVLVDELRDLGFRSARLNSGGIPFMGELQDGWKACLHTCIGQRVMLVLGRFPAENLDQIYLRAKTLPGNSISPRNRLSPARHTRTQPPAKTPISWRSDWVPDWIPANSSSRPTRRRASKSPRTTGINK